MKRTLLIFFLLFFTLTSYETYGQATCDAETIDVTVDVESSQTDNKHAETFLTAENIIKSGGTAHYKAGNSVTLLPGFHAKSGSDFTASIETCTPFSGTFITKWETISTNESITIPTFSGETYSYTVNWGDGSTDSTIYTGDALHTYSSANTYTVTITGTFPRIYFNNTGDKDKIVEIVDWGDMVWSSMENAFYGCSQLDITDTDALDLTGVTNLSGMFRDCNSLTKDISDWDINGVTHMVRMLESTSSFDHSLAAWDISSNADMSNALDYSGISYINLDTTFITWENKASQNNITNVTLGGETLFLCNGSTAYFNLRDNQNWTFTGINPGFCKSLSIEDNEISKFLIYPNPATDKLYISTTTLNKLTIQIIDVSGRIVLKKTNSKKIDISALKRGVYFVQILGEEKKMVKLIKS